MQTGLECIGDIGSYDIFEAVWLAAQSLETITDDFVLEVSHLGILTALLNETSDNENFRREISHCIAWKKIHMTSAGFATVTIYPQKNRKSFVLLQGFTETWLML